MGGDASFSRLADRLSLARNRRLQVEPLRVRFSSALTATELPFFLLQYLALVVGQDNYPQDLHTSVSSQKPVVQMMSQHETSPNLFWAPFMAMGRHSTESPLKRYGDWSERHVI